MQLTHLLVAFAAGSAVAHEHIHDHAQAHAHRRNDEVVATIDGKVVSWANNYFPGGQPEATAAPASSPAASPASSAPEASPTASEAPQSSASESTSASSSEAPQSSASDSQPNDDWAKEEKPFTTEGFGESTKPSMIGEAKWDFKGNVGNPYGSNIKVVSGQQAPKYENVMQFKANGNEKMNVVMWNKIGPTGGLNGFFNKNPPVKFTVSPGEAVYVSFDKDSQGGFAAAKGEVPMSDAGYGATWGEFDFGNSANNGWSGWDVSSIVAQKAKLPVIGMKICKADGSSCSSMKANAQDVDNAYTEADTGKNGIGGSQSGGNGVRLTVTLDY